MNSICPHPWRRFFARVIDTVFFLIVSMSLFILMFGRTPLAAQKLDAVLAYLFIIASNILIESIFLHFFATTPGKFVFGISLTEYNGAKLSFTDSVFRTFLVYGGFGFGLALLFPILLIYHYSKYKKGQELFFDKDLSYNINTHRFSRTVLYFIAIFLLTRICSALIYNNLVTPPNKGYINLTELSENYEYLRKLNYLDDWTLSMDSEGNFFEKISGPFNYTFYPEDSLSISNIPLFNENGDLQAIKFTFSTFGNSFSLRDRESMLLILAFSGCNSNVYNEIMDSAFLRSIIAYVDEPVQAHFDTDDGILHFGFRLINVSAETSWGKNMYAQDPSKPCSAELIMSRYSSVEEMEAIAEFF